MNPHLLLVGALLTGCSSRWPTEGKLISQLADSHYQLEKRGYSNIVFDADLVYASKSNATYYGSANNVSPKGCVIRGEWGRVQ